MAAGTTHCVLVDTPDGRLQDFFPYDKVSYSSVEKLRALAAETDATLVFGHDPDQIKQLRVAPAGSYR
jgi:glyoxylase-like metal-dependent hydrolase (beta-lactamase superfamily II)